MPDDKWTVPDLSALAFDSVLATQDIPLGLTTITDGCYSVPQTLIVLDGATLQLREGVVLKFGESAKLYVEVTRTALPRLFEGVDIVIPDLSVPIVWGGLTIESGSLTILPGADLKMLGSRKVEVDGPVTIVGMYRI